MERILSYADDGDQTSFNAENYNSGMRKKKRVNNEEYYTLLVLTILYAEGIEKPSTNPSADNRIYKVVTAVENRKLGTTPEVYGLPNPEWNWRLIFPLDNLMDCKFLYLEVIRTNSISDPGTSYGETTVGRVRIPLPTRSTKKEGRFGLVRLEGPGYKAEGHIRLSMELITQKKIV